MRETLRECLPYLLISLIAALSAGGPAVAADPPPGFHGMLVLGTRDNVYLVHLAMRSNPTHMFQLILKVDFTRGEDTEVGDSTFLAASQDLESLDPTQLYFLDRNHPDNDAAVYTFQPREGFVLKDIPRGKRLTFRGDVVRGHFERDLNPPVPLRDVVVRVRDVVYFQDLRELNPSLPHPLAAEKREYLLFGSGGEYFLSHKISLHGDTGRPDNNGFHQVLPVRASEELTSDLSSGAVAVDVAVGETDAVLFPVKSSVFRAVLKGPGEDQVRNLSLEVGPEHYFEELL